jgi:hypothetical protein
LKNNLFNKALAALAEFRPGSLESPDAWVGHMPFAYWAVQQLEPKVLVELGTHSGNSYFSFCQSILENDTKTKAFAVDTWGGDIHAGFYDESVFNTVVSENEKYKDFSSLMRETFDSASANFEDGSIDLLHIDGLHTYEAVKHDFETWFPKMAAGGFILFHDTQVFKEGFGVHKLWAEVSKNFSTMEFGHSNGLGILQVSPGSKTLIPSEKVEQIAMESFFSGLSSYMLSVYREKILSSQITELQLEANLLASERDSLFRAQDALLRSWSWKITSPLRWLLRLLRRI